MRCKRCGEKMCWNCKTLFNDSIFGSGRDNGLCGYCSAYHRDLEDLRTEGYYCEFCILDIETEHTVLQEVEPPTTQQSKGN